MTKMGQQIAQLQNDYAQDHDWMVQTELGFKTISQRVVPEEEDDTAP
jgi:hypothetical protein